LEQRYPRPWRSLNTQGNSRGKRKLGHGCWRCSAWEGAGRRSRLPWGRREADHGREMTLAVLPACCRVGGMEELLRERRRQGGRMVVAAGKKMRGGSAKMPPLARRWLLFIEGH
jgi:hypothetical protein